MGATPEGSNGSSLKRIVRAGLLTGVTDGVLEIFAGNQSIPTRPFTAAISFAES